MKNLLMALTLVTSFNALAAKPVKAIAPAEAATYAIDNNSKLTWLGKKVGGEHSGTIGIKSGSLKFDDKKLVGGEFEVDMTSIAVSDIKDPEYNGKLVGHLKSDDFFSVEKNPSATLKIKSAKKEKGNTYNVVGDLTIKGITNEVTFKADVTDADKEVSAKAKLVFDRTKFKVEYNSGKIFKSIGDKLIYDDVELNIDLMAKK
ncbi:MAG: YceI family protein [Bacteriovoracaceae bacterium]